MGVTSSEMRVAVRLRAEFERQLADLIVTFMQRGISEEQIGEALEDHASDMAAGLPGGDLKPKPQQWEYISFNSAPGEDRYSQLRAMGAEGWEAWHIEQNADGWREVYLKRRQP